MTAGATDRILVVGEAVVDVITTEDGSVRVPGGGPANIAVALAQLGRSVDLLTALGSDDDGVRIDEHLRLHGVHVRGESWTSSPTSTAVAHLDATGAASYSFDIHWEPAKLPPQPALAAVHVGSLGAYLAPGAHITADVLQQTIAAEVSFDPNIRPDLLRHAAALARTSAILAEATIVKLSDEDAAWLYPDLDALAVLDLLLESGPRLVALTRGSDGALLRSTDSDVVSVKSHPRLVSDTIGAGDSFMAGIIDAVLQLGGSQNLNTGAVRQVGQWASAIAGLVVEQTGARMPSRDDVARRLAE